MEVGGKNQGYSGNGVLADLIYVLFTAVSFLFPGEGGR